MDVSNENNKIIKDQNEPNKQIEYEINNKKEEKSNLEKNTKEKIPTLPSRKMDNELDSIIKKDPLEELKLIKQKIKEENSKIKQINSQLEKISTNNNSISNKSPKKRNLEFKDEYDTYTNNLKKRNNNLLSPNIIVSSSQQIAKNNSSTLDPSLHLIYKKMENLRKIKFEKTNSNDKNIDIEDPNNMPEKRYIPNVKTSMNKIDSRLLALEEEVKKDKEEKQKKYEIKAKL